MSRTPKMDQYSFYSHYRAMGITAARLLGDLWKDYEASYDHVEVVSTGMIDMKDPERNEI